MIENPIGLDGMEFIEYTGPSPELFTALFSQLGMVEIGAHKNQRIKLFRQNDVQFLLNEEPGSFAADFTERHGPSVCSTGFRVKDAQAAFKEAVARGAKPYDNSRGKTSFDWPAIYGIGDSLVYFIDKYGAKGSFYDDEFNYSKDKNQKGSGFLLVDHMTNNVPKGELDKWANFYETIFNFKEIRFFDIKGSATGLLSRAMRSPCGKITIPINEPTEDKSQIQEYIDEYRGSGIQHIALLTEDICSSVKSVKDAGIPTLDVPDTYYEMLNDRVPNITENMKTLQGLRLLVDGDDEGYLLQIFTQNLIGPIFYEFIQRKNHWGFGEGNFKALFEAIERDQRRRGVL